MNLIEIVKFFLSLMIGLVPTLFIYVIIAMVIIRSREQANPPKPAEFHPDRHIYYPHRPLRFLKLLYMFMVGALLCLVLPFVVTLIIYRLFRTYLVVLPLIVLGILQTVKIVKAGSAGITDYLIVTSEALIVHYKSGLLEKYACSSHSGYNNGENGIVYVIFRNENGMGSMVSLEGLSDSDVHSLISDLERIKKCGDLSGTGQQKQTARNAQQTTQSKKEQEKEKLTLERKRELVKMIEAGDSITAIKFCREWTGLGLKEAKAMVEEMQASLPDVKDLKPEEQPSIQIINTAPMPETQPVTQTVNMVPLTEPVSGRETVSAETPVFTGSPVPTETPVFTESPVPAEEAVPAGKELSWTLRITDKEQAVSEKRSLERSIDQALAEIGRKREEFLVLSPSEPVHGICFMQACAGSNGLNFRVEAGLEKKDGAGQPVILFKERLMGWEARNICMAFYQGEEIPMTDWAEAEK